MFFIDSHSHLYLDNFNEDIEIVINRSINEGVTKIILPAIDSSNYFDLINLSNKYPDTLFPCIGLHPTSVNKDFKKELIFIENELKKHKNIAIGECGIDLYWDKKFINEQKEAFIFQSKLAIQNNLPIIIHTRDSIEICLDLVEKYFDKTKENGVFHCFSGNLQQAKKTIDLGFKIGIGGVITFKNNSLIEIVKKIPLEYIILETDSPFLAPMPFRGKRNESSYIKYIAATIAEIKNISLTDVAKVTSQNAKNLFKI